MQASERPIERSNERATERAIDGEQANVRVSDRAIGRSSAALNKRASDRAIVRTTERTSERPSHSASDRTRKRASKHTSYGPHGLSGRSEYVSNLYASLFYFLISLIGSPGLI